MIRNVTGQLLLLLLLLLRASCAFLYDDRLEYKEDIDNTVVTDDDTDVSSHSKAYDIYVRSLLLYNEGVSKFISVFDMI